MDSNLGRRIAIYLVDVGTQSLIVEYICAANIKDKALEISN
ncbi:MAG: hypothetical protein P4L87_05840 [Formivibrio sp.]|nr:hypothetical protein [Formivibrio sp.]